MYLFVFVKLRFQNICTQLMNVLVVHIHLLSTDRR